MIEVRATRIIILFVGLAVWVIGIFTDQRPNAYALIALGAALITLGIVSKAWDKDHAD